MKPDKKPVLKIGTPTAFICNGKMVVLSILSQYSEKKNPRFLAYQTTGKVITQNDELVLKQGGKTFAYIVWEAIDVRGECMIYRRIKAKQKRRGA